MQPRQRRRRLVPRPVDPDLPIVLSSDTSGEDLLQPEQLQPGHVVVDIDSSADELPDIDPRHRPPTAAAAPVAAAGDAASLCFVGATPASCGTAASAS